ncbi:MAG: DUF927 domain-containing protein [bacterium]
MKKDLTKQDDLTDDFHPNLWIDGDFLMISDVQTGEIKKLARRVEIIQRLRNVDDKSIQLKLRYLDSDGSDNIILLNREDVFTKRGAAKLQAVGVDCPDYLFNIIMRFLRDSESSAETINIHTTLGWNTENEKIVYRHNESLGGNSTYGGDFRLEPIGSLKGQLEWIDAHVIGFGPMELAVAIGLAAPVLGLLQQSMPLESMPIHIFNDSSKGKTTALRCMLSLGGSPDAVNDGITRKEGLLKTLHATDNAILSSLRGNHGLLAGFDETGSLSVNDLTPLIYRISEGKEKGRLNRNSDIRRVETWGTVVVTTGEFPISSRLSHAIGARIRLLEIGEVQWTKSPEHADDIRAAIMQHNGHIIPAFAEYLLSVPESEIVERWQNWREWCVDQMEFDPFASRLADRYAVILLAGQLAHMVLNQPLDTEGLIWPLLLNANNATAEQRDLAKSALECLKEAVARNSHKFPTEGPIAYAREIWGRINSNSNGTKSLFIYPNDFRRILREAMFEDSETVLAVWRTKGWLEHEKGKYTRKKTMVSGQNGINVIVIKNWEAI